MPQSRCPAAGVDGQLFGRVRMPWLCILTDRFEGTRGLTSTGFITGMNHLDHLTS